MSEARPTADSRPRAVMLSSALQPASTITTASLASGPLTRACTLEPGTHTQTVRYFTHICSFVQQAHGQFYTCIHSCRYKAQILECVLYICRRMHQTWSKEQAQFTQSTLDNIRADVRLPQL